MENDPSHADVPEPPRAAALVLPTVSELGQSPESFRGDIDIALANLICASGLPGAENLDVPAQLARVDEAARIVRAETEWNYQAFIDDPAALRILRRNSAWSVL